MDTIKKETNKWRISSSGDGSGLWCYWWLVIVVVVEWMNGCVKENDGKKIWN